MPILLKIEPPLPERCTLRQAVQYLAQGIMPVPIEYEPAVGISRNIDPEACRGALRQLYVACLEGKITLEGQAIIGFGNTGKPMLIKQGRMPIPVKEVAAGELEAFDIQRNTHRRVWSWGFVKYVDLDSLTSPLLETFPPNEPMTLVASADIAPAADQSSGSPVTGVKPAGGRPPKFLWNEIWFHLMRHFHIEGRPQTRAAVVRLVQELCTKQGFDVPDESTLRPKIRELFKIWPEDPNSSG